MKTFHEFVKEKQLKESTMSNYRPGDKFDYLGQIYQLNGLSPDGSVAYLKSTVDPNDNTETSASNLGTKQFRHIADLNHPHKVGDVFSNMGPNYKVSGFSPDQKTAYLRNTIDPKDNTETSVANLGTKQFRPVPH